MIIDSKKYNGKCSCGKEHKMITEFCIIEEGALKDFDKYIKEKYVEAEDVYMKKIRNIINVLDAMGINDTYSQELKERYQIIADYLNNR